MSRSQKLYMDVKLSDKDIKRAIREVTGLKRVFRKRLDRVAERLSEDFKDEIEQAYSEADGDYIVNEGYQGVDARASVRKVNGGFEVSISGKDVVFAEFGAGVHFNGPNSPHPLADEYGYEIGSYGKGMGNREAWGFRDGSGLRISMGTPADMPAYRSFQKIKDRVQDIAEEEFGEEFGDWRKK